MQQQPIGLIAAMPEELTPLLHQLSPAKREKLGIFPLYRTRCAGRDIFLIQSGIGAENAANATAALINLASPEFIINFGFAGGIEPGLKPGDLVMAERVMLQRERLFSEQPGLDKPLQQRVTALLGRESVKGATFITTKGVKNKQELARLMPKGTYLPVVEMETAAVLKVAARDGVPLLALRSISDTAEEELGFSIEEFTDKNMLSIKPAKVIWAISRKPWLIPQLLRLGSNSKLAGAALANAVQRIITDLAAAQ